MEHENNGAQAGLITSVFELMTFLKQFHRRWMDHPELDSSLVPTDLPEGLALIYREFGALINAEPDMELDGKGPFAAQDALVQLNMLKRNGDMITFAWENQGNWSCRCRVNEPDPPVYSNAADIWDAQAPGFQLVCDSLNHFLITLCLQEALFSCRYLIAVHDKVALRDAVRAELVTLWLRGQYVYGEPTHDFYYIPDREAIVMHYSGLWIGSPASPVLDLLMPGNKYMSQNFDERDIMYRVSGET